MSIYCYLLEDEKRNKLNLDIILEELGITADDAENYRQQEMEFQKFVTGQRKSTSEIRNLIGHKILKPMEWMDKYRQVEDVLRFQVYEDSGQGYSEEASYFIPQAFLGDSWIETQVAVSGNVLSLRLDPVMSSCVLKIHELIWNGNPINYHNKKLVITNGKAATDSFIFATEDPNINIKVSELPRLAENILSVKMEVKLLPLSIAQDLAGAVKKIL